jgi:hypothetical protein
VRLFGRVTGIVDRFDRAEWLTLPFDLALGLPPARRATPDPLRASSRRFGPDPSRATSRRNTPDPLRATTGGP